MMNVKGAPTNRRIFIKIDKINENTRRGIRKAFYFIGKKIMKDLNKDLLRKPRSGKISFIRTSGGGRRRHVASVPGEAPANRTGNLRRSRNFLVQGWNIVKIGYKAQYGKFLEFGTKRMKARPGIKINIKKNDRNIQHYFSSEIKKALN